MCEGSWRFRAGRNRVGLCRPLVLFDVFPDDRRRRRGAGCREVGGGPEVPVGEVGVDAAGEFFAEVVGGDAFEAVDEGGDREVRRVADEQADVVVVAVELAEFRSELRDTSRMMCPHRVSISPSRRSWRYL